MPARTRAYLMLLLVAAIWGAAGPIIKYTLTYFEPTLFLTYRFLLTCALLVPLQLLLHPKTIRNLATLTTKQKGYLAVSGVLGSTVQLGLLFIGYSLTTSLDATIINDSLPPIITAFLGHRLLGERITHRERLGLTIAFIGSLLVVVQPIWESGRFFTGSLAGNLIVLTASGVWAAYALLTKRQLHYHTSPLLLTSSMFTMGFLSMFAILLATQTPYHVLTTLSTAPLSAHLGVMYMAALSGALAYFLYQSAQKTIEASEANVFLYLPPIFTFPLSVLWLKEPITAFLVIGCLLIAVGVYVSATKVNRQSSG